MDPLTIATSGVAVVTSYTIARAIDAAVDAAAQAIIRPCAERRAHSFFRQLVEALAEPGEVDSSKIAAGLNAVTKDEAAREVVFEFYRQSLLSRSKEVGPRILALLVARLLKEHRNSTESEQRIAEVAERCTDVELSAFTAYYRSALNSSEQKGKTSSPAFRSLLEFQTSTPTIESPRHTIRTGPISLSKKLGSWAAKFEQAGLIEQVVESSESQQRIRRGSALTSTTTETSWYIAITPACSELVHLWTLAAEHP